MNNLNVSAVKVLSAMRIQYTFCTVVSVLSSYAGGSGSVLKTSAIFLHHGYQAALPETGSDVVPAE